MTTPANFPTPDHVDWAQSTADTVFAATGFYRWPSVALGQAILESEGFTRLSGKNNGHGIKATQAQISAGRATARVTHEVINGRDTTITAYFADFDSPEASYLANAQLFVNVPVYRAARTAPNAETFIDLMSPHYATAPNYATVLKGICRGRNLYRFDEAHGPGTKITVGGMTVTVSPKPTPAPSLWARIRAWFAAHNSRET